MEQDIIIEGVPVHNFSFADFEDTQCILFEIHAQDTVQYFIRLVEKEHTIEKAQNMFTREIQGAIKIRIMPEQIRKTAAIVNKQNGTILIHRYSLDIPMEEENKTILKELLSKHFPEAKITSKEL